MVYICYNIRHSWVSRRQNIDQGSVLKNHFKEVIMPLEIKVVKKKNYVYSVELKGSIDTETSYQLEDELREIIDEKTRAVILNMGVVNYISSAGIRAVIWAKKTLEQRNATFAMIDLQPQIKKVFDVMRILPMIDIFDDMPEADKYIDQIIKEEIEKNNK
ncbi:MAG: hypothetical protein A2Z72_04420 [Omnitrophica bacterium RBG_13_46_9]|nr:MAG: hypothetical protein A2Z72_04420 [Omnitrophica bacterium RBG_13_46_9]